MNEGVEIKIKFVHLQYKVIENGISSEDVVEHHGGRTFVPGNSNDDQGVGQA